MEDISLQVFFFFPWDSFVWLLYQNNHGHIKWVGKCSRFYFLEDFVWVWNYFFLKCLLGLSSKASWPGVLFVERFLMTLISLYIWEYLGFLFLFEIDLVICVCQRICPLNLSGKFISIKLFIMFPHCLFILLKKFFFLLIFLGHATRHEGS